MKTTLEKLTKNIDMVIFNNITNITDDLELVSWKEFYNYNELYTNTEFEKLKSSRELEEEINFTDESDSYKEIFQYFAINQHDGEYLSSKTWLPLYYSSNLDLHILGIDFLDNWANISYEI